MAARESKWLYMAQNGSKSVKPLKKIPKVPNSAKKLRRRKNEKYQKWLKHAKKSQKVQKKAKEYNNRKMPENCYKLPEIARPRNVKKCQKVLQHAS